jgi:ubiquinol-cytochrome c reductase cytochrome b subunit
MSTVAERSAARKRAQQQQKALDWADDRLGSSGWLRSAMDKIFPDHWSFMVGEIAMYTFVILIATGIYLALFYTASDAIVIYHGVYKPLDGQAVTEAYASTVNISFSVRAGLVIRQAHHWAALIFLAAITFHMCRVFFTGAFRRPREINWIIGVTLLLLAMLEGFSGYSLPDDLLSGSGLRVVFSIVESIPFVGVWLAFTVWGGNFPGTLFFQRLFVIHEFLFPLLLAGLLGGHIWARRPCPDQRDLDLRPLPGRSSKRRHPAGLVRRLARRRSATVAALGVPKFWP